METRNETRPAPMTPDAEGARPPAEKSSLFEDFIDILYAPSSVFTRRSRADFGIYLLIISLAAALLTFANRGVFMQVADAQYTAKMADAMQKNPQLTAEVVERMRGVNMTIAAVLYYVITPIIVLISALFLWVFARMVGARLAVKQSVLVATLASVPRILGLVAIAIQIAFMDTANVTNMGQLSIGPARFMDHHAANRMLYGLASGLDLFAVWNAVLVGIGVAVIGKVSAGRAAIAGLLYFVLATLPLLFQ